MPAWQTTLPGYFPSPSQGSVTPGGGGIIWERRRPTGNPAPRPRLPSLTSPLGLSLPRRGTSPPPHRSSPLSPPPPVQWGMSPAAETPERPRKGLCKGGGQSKPSRTAVPQFPLFPHPGLELFGAPLSCGFGHPPPHAASWSPRCSCSPSSGVDTSFVTSAVCPLVPHPPSPQRTSYLPAFWLYFNLSPVFSAPFPPASPCS